MPALNAGVIDGEAVNRLRELNKKKCKNTIIICIYTFFFVTLQRNLLKLAK